MKKRLIISIVASMSLFLSFGLLSCKPQVSEKFTVGIINPSPGLVEVVSGFKEGMEKRGYREGENISYMYEGPLGGMDRVDAVIQEMLEREVDLVYSLTTPATKKLKKALKGSDVPGVFAPVFDPVSSGIVDSLARPGGQLTGVKVRGSTAKALDWLLSIVPDVKRIFIPFHITDKAACLTVEDLQATAEKFDIELVSEEVTTNEEIDRALNRIPDDADAVWLTCSHLLMTNVDKIVEAALAKKIPTASSTHSRHRSAVLVSYGESDRHLGNQVSRLADKILKGVHPSSVPVENAEYILGINLQTARILSLTVPEKVIRQADFVVR